MNTTLITTLLATIATVSLSAATVSLDFESGTTGWSFIDTSGNGDGTYTTTAGNGSATAGSFDWTGANQVVPGAYLVNDGMAAFDLTQNITGSFDFNVVEDGNYSTIHFMMGNLGSGLPGADGGGLSFHLQEKTFGARARLYDAGNTGLIVDSDNSREITSNQWITVNFSWTPTSGTTGDIVFEWDDPVYGPNPGPNSENLNYTGYTFTSSEAYFAFGTGRSPALFDNISITGEPVPEASTAVLGLVGALALLRRRR